MKITAIVPDKAIFKNGVKYYELDNSFWTQFSGVHAFRIDTENTSYAEMPDCTKTSVTQSQIDTLHNKWTELKTAADNNAAAEQAKIDTYNASWERVRNQRNNLLLESDACMISDYPINEEKRNEFVTYRSSLRNIPETYSSEDPSNIVINDETGEVKVNGATVITKPSL
jgi:hypothetical protein